ncbi:uncharacterized protein LOC143254642 isoform X1 [Tachypleus tridentatus]
MIRVKEELKVRYDYRRFWWAAFEYKNMFRFCKPPGEDPYCRHEKFFHPTHGNCFTFNADFQGNNDTLNISFPKKEDQTFLDDPTSYVFVLQFDKRDFLGNPGALITFHQPEEIPDFATRQLITPGEFSDFRIVQSTYHYLPWPYDTNCVDYRSFGTTEGRKLILGMNGCFAECITNTSFKICNCVLLGFTYQTFLPDPYGLALGWKPRCADYSTFAIFGGAIPINCSSKSSEYTEERKRCLSKCGVPCRKILYNILTSKHAILDNEQRQLPEVLKTEDRSSLAIVRVRIINRNEKVHITHPKYQWFHVLYEAENIVIICIALIIGLNLLQRKVTLLLDETEESCGEAKD